jgi:hypothetical protein
MVHGLPFMVLVLLQLERVGSLVVVTMVVFVEVALVGKLFWIVLTHFGANGSALALLFWSNPSVESFVCSRARF